MTEDKQYDVIIVGGGHAGLSAALTLYRQLHSVLIFDTNKPRNKWPLPTHIVTGWEGSPVEELRAASRAELADTGLVSFNNGEVKNVQQIEEGFDIEDEHGNHSKGRKLLIAAGKRNVFPTIPGYEENYPERIFHCMFTFGYEHRGSNRAGLLAEGALSSPMHAAMVVGDTKKFAKHVVVFTNGNASLRTEVAGYIDTTGVDFDDRPIRCMRGVEAGLEVELEDAEVEKVDFLVHQPSTRIELPIVQQLGLKLDERGDIVNTPPFFQTNVPGVFAAGDCASPFKIIPMAMFMGANAAAGIARSLAADRFKPRRAPEAEAEADRPPQNVQKPIAA